MHIRLTYKRAFHRAGAALMAAVMVTTGLSLATSTSAAAAPSTGSCGRTPATSWYPLPAAWFVGDPAALYPSRDGTYNSPGSANVAYKITGEFPHSTTMSFTTYDDMWYLPGEDYLLNDVDVAPDPGSVNPFVPGTKVMGQPRNYTVYMWPDSVPVPRGLKNVFLYPTKAADPRDQNARWYVTMRLYHMQPGYSAIASEPALTAISALNPSQEVACPLSPVVGTVPRLLPSIYRHITVAGPIGKAPEPTTGNKVYFTRYPGLMGIGPEGYPADGCINYVMATLPPDKITVVTQHKVPQFFNNNAVTEQSIMKDYQVRWQSQVIARWPENPRLSVNQDDSVYTPDGKWVTVYLPIQPRLSAAQERTVRRQAAVLHYNVIQIPRDPVNRPIARLLPWPVVILRQKAPSADFPYSVLNVPCWATPQNYREYPNQTSPAFFARYASSPRNMGPYYIDGEKMSYAQFIDFSSNQ
jgi:hypothetical protein